MQALEKLWQQLTAAMGTPALILVATAFILVEFLDALLKVTEKNLVVSLPSVILFSLGALFALGFVIRTRYDVDVQSALRQAVLAGAAGSLIGALIYVFELAPADSPADAFARYVVLGWPLALCYGFALSLVDSPDLAVLSVPSVDAEMPPPASSERFNWRARATALAVFLATIVLPPAAVVAQFAVQWPVSFVSSESVVVGLAVFLLAKAYLRLSDEAPRDHVSEGGHVQRFSNRGRRMVLLVTALMGSGIVVWKAKASLLPSMPFLFSIAEAVPLAMLSITLLLVWSTLVYMLAVMSPLRWVFRTQIVMAILLVLVGWLSMPGLVPDQCGDRAERVERWKKILDPDDALARARDRGAPRERAEALKCVAEILRDQGRWSDAESAIRETIVIRAALEVDEESIASDRDLLAQLLTRRAAYRQAEELLRQILATRADLFKKAPSPTRKLALLASRRSLASNLVDQEQYERASVLLRLNDDMFRDLTRPSSLSGLFSADIWRPYTAQGNRERLQEYAHHLLLCGRVAREMGRSASAEECLKKALRIAELFTGRMDGFIVDIATIYARLGRLYFLTGRLGEADVEFHRALASDPGAIVAGVVKAQMADLRSAEQRFDQAEYLYREADQLLEETLGPDHPYHLMVLPAFAKVLAQRGDHVRALQVVARAQVLAATIYGPGARRTAAIQDTCYEIVAARDRAERADVVSTGAQRKGNASQPDHSRDIHRPCGAVRSLAASAH